MAKWNRHYSADENVWLSQKMIAALYDVVINTINYRIKKAIETNEIDEKSVIRNFRITAKLLIKH